MTRKEIKKLLDNIINSAHKYMYLFGQEDIKAFNKLTIQAVDKSLREALNDPDLRVHYEGKDGRLVGSKILYYDIDYEIKGTMLEAKIIAQCEVFPELIHIEFTLPEKK